MMFDKVKIEAIAKTYLRAAAAAVAALYMTDPNRPIKEYLAAGIAAVVGPIFKAIDPKATEFGRGSK
jgi:hypothetical protein